MASDTEDLVLSISADVRQMQRALARITSDTDKTTKTLQRQFNDMGAKTEASFDRAAAGATRAFTVIDGGAKRVATSMRASSMQTANLAAQLNDIGVQLAGGTSPFQIALQQGTQINQVLGQQGVRGAVGLLAGSFASLVNPVSLATIAIIGLGGAAIQYFTELLSSGEKSEETLKREADLIQGVAKEWGDALPALKAYADERARLNGETQIQEATNLQIEEIFRDAKAQVTDLRAGLGALIVDLQQAGASDIEIIRVQKAFEAFSDAIENNRDSAKENKELLAALATVYINSGVPAANDFAASIYNIADAFAAFAARAAEAQAQAAAAIQAGRVANFQKTLPNNLGQIPPVLSGGGKLIDEAELQNLRANLRKSQTQIEAERSSRGGGRRQAASEAEREAEAVRKLIEQLQFEQDMIGMTDEQRAVANALRRAGAAATEEQKAKIEELVLATEREREALKASEEAMKLFQDIGKDFLSGFISDLKSGKSAAEAMENALSRLSDRILDLALNALFSGIGGGGGLFSFLFKNAKGNAFSGGRVTPFARGGVVTRPTVFPMAKGMGLMGEAGPEAVMPLARDALGRLGVRSEGNAGTSISMPITISAPGADPAQLARVERAVRDLGESIPRQVDARMRNKQLRGVRP